jgi:hypothetical protein
VRADGQSRLYTYMNPVKQQKLTVSFLKMQLLRVESAHEIGAFHPFAGS